MEVIAIKPGFYGKLRSVDEKFDVAEGAKASWFVPVEKASAPKATGKKADPAPPADGLV